MHQSQPEKNQTDLSQPQAPPKGDKLNITLAPKQPLSWKLLLLIGVVAGAIAAVASWGMRSIMRGYDSYAEEVPTALRISEILGQQCYNLLWAALAGAVIGLIAAAGQVFE